jgi:hypothetical protein
MDAPQQPRPRARPLDALWLAGLAGLAAAAWAGFAALGVDYFGFWQRSGALIGLGTAALGWAWRSLDNHPGLISANPRIFAGSALQLAGLPLTAFGGHLRSRGRISGFDRLAILPAGVVFAVAVIGWLLLIAPAQYFVFLLAGAPSRVALASDYRLFAHFGRDGRLTLVERDTAPPDPGWWDAAMRDRPVSMAGVFAAAGFAVLNLMAGFL